MHGRPICGIIIPLDIGEFNLISGEITPKKHLGRGWPYSKATISLPVWKGKDNEIMFEKYLVGCTVLWYNIL